MKRSLKSSEEEEEKEEIIFFPASLSQMDVAGSEEACTSIAVMACVDRLTSNAQPTAEKMELWIHQGGAICGRYSHAKEIIDLVSPALPICAGDEYGGSIWKNDEDPFVSLPQALQKLPKDTVAAVLTIGAFSMALFIKGTDTVELFDSHAVYNGKTAAFMRFPGGFNQLTEYLQGRFGGVDIQYSLCVVRKRFCFPPKVFPLQNQAFDLADTLPAGFFYVWARDIKKTGAKDYLVAGLDDFYAYYDKLKQEARSHYEVIRKGRPVTFHVDLEFESFEENKGDGLQMTQALCELAAEQWEEEQQHKKVSGKFHIYDSSTKQKEEEDDDDDGEDIEPMSLGEDIADEEEDEEEDEEDGLSRSLSDSEEKKSDSSSHSSDEYAPDEENIGKVSFHVHNQSMWFNDTEALHQFVLRVEQRAKKHHHHKLLWVWKKVWNGKDHVMEKQFFADKSIYSANRCFRLPLSSKLGKNRYLLPVDETSSVFDALVCPPTNTRLYLRNNPRAAAAAVEPAREMIPAANGDLLPLDHHSCPAAIRALGQAVNQHYKPEKMRGFKLAPTGLITFSMVKHDCEICHDAHNNQVYVVADLRSRVFYQKCHADRNKMGSEIPFPMKESFSMANANEMQPGQRAIEGVFPATSSTARMVLGFAGAIYESARTAPKIPQNVPVHYDKVNKQYEVTLADVCSTDGGTQVLQITQSKLIIRCKGRKCASKGKRWDRPSHSSSASARPWNLSFLFPDDAIVSVSTSGSSTSTARMDLTPERFVEEEEEEWNFYRALGFESNDVSVALIKDRLQQLSDWAIMKQKESFNDALALSVARKVSIVEKILGEETMEACYRECLKIAPDFEYPIALIPRGPVSLAIALLIHLAEVHNFKRVGDDFYFPTNDATGNRRFYQTIPLKKLLTHLCSFKVAPNLCSAVMWHGRVCDDLIRVLKDENHFPPLQVSKRYLGYRNVVYDLEENTTLTWQQVKCDPDVIPFNYLEQDFPVDALEMAKKNCPEIAVEDGEVMFSSNKLFPPTPLFEQTLKDQEFSSDVIIWLLILMGRMFHYVGKAKGDNWELFVYLIGAPGTFKSSIISFLKSFLQEHQIGVLGTKVEAQFPLSSVAGKLMVFMSECGGCTLDRSMLKQMASGDPVNIASKHQQAINVPNWDIPVLFAGNSFLNMQDTDGSVLRKSVVFPFTRLLKASQGSTTLTSDIIQKEGPLLLIKANTLYLAAKRAIHEPIHPLLPLELREATQQAIMRNDPLLSFISQRYVVTDDEDDVVSWDAMWSAYLEWCKRSGKQPYTAGPLDVEVQTMLCRLEITLSEDSSTLIGIRPRNAQDPPYRAAFQVKFVQREKKKEEE